MPLTFPNRIVMPAACLAQSGAGPYCQPQAVHRQATTLATAENNVEPGRNCTSTVPGAPARLLIGNRDARWDDVYAEGARRQLTSHLWFIGPRYFPTDFRPRFVRSDETGDVGFRITFYLLDSLPPDDLPKANLPVEHDGNILRYTVADGAEGLSLDYSTMRRWYGVDQIEIEPL